MIGLSYIVALLLDKYKESKHPNNSKPSYTQKSSNNKDEKVHNPPAKDYSEINNEIEEVIRWIGVSEPVNTSEMFEKVQDGKEKEVINEIALQLSLPMEIITKISDEVKQNEDGTSILAEVSLGHVPPFGSKSFDKYPCTIILYPGYSSRPDRFIYVIAHELCHYVLHSLRPGLPDKAKEERLTDLAVIFGGFESAYRTGWHSHAFGNAGYIQDEEDLMYIRRRYESILVKRRQLFEKISDGYKELLGNQSDKLLFLHRCELLLAHPNEKIMDEDMEAIGRSISSVGANEIRRILKIKTELEPFLQKKTRYGEMVDDEKQLAELAKLLKRIQMPSKEDVSILMKYTDNY